MWDPTTGLSFIIYTQLEFCKAPECEDFNGALTACVYGAIQDPRL